MTAHDASRSAEALSIRGHAAAKTLRALPEETPVALVYNGTTQAVMMATPEDLEDFSVGFSITEGLVGGREEIESLEIVSHAAGIEARMWIAQDRADALATRRRAMAGPVGCGLCGIDSLDQALRPLVPIPDGEPVLEAAEVDSATTDLRAGQPLHDRTRAVHAAGLWRPGEGIAVVREDVGRHNALDKLVGAMARSGIDGTRGAVVLTSRVSIEMVQKTVAARVPVLIAASAPTARAVTLAREAGLTLAANARGQGFDLFCHPHRIRKGSVSDVA